MVDIRVLILVIDRDDDFGKKVGVKGLVIGRVVCLDVVVKFSLVDFEDSDVNVFYVVIKFYDKLKEKGEFDDVEVVLIMGYLKVGLKSDMEFVR